MNMELHVGWLLHKKPYKEHSVIASCLISGKGRIDMVVNGVRTNRSSRASFLQPFNKILLSWRGRGELKNLTSMECSDFLSLRGKALYCGFYVNELITRSVMPGQYVEGVADLYERIIGELATVNKYEPVLRLFELELLELVGYAPTWDRDSINGDLVEEGKYYRFDPNFGLLPWNKEDDPNVYPGHVLLSIVRRDFQNSGSDFWHKKLMRQALIPIVGNVPLRTRELFLPCK